MYPTLRFNEIITLYKPTTNDYGKDVLGTGEEVKALYEQITGHEHGNFQDSLSGTSRLYLDASNQFLLDNAYRLEGMILKINPFNATDSDQYFRITACIVGRDMLRYNQVRHVECELQKTDDFDNEV